MDKKIIKAMYDNIVAKDQLKMVMMGVHFEESRCYASDGHVLIIYNESQPRLKGKTIMADGTEYDGRYPNVDMVFPSSKEECTKVKIDAEQLKNACIWHGKKLLATNSTDRVVIGGVAFNIATFARLLKVVCMFGKEQTLKLYGRTRPAVIEGKGFKGIVMPMEYADKDVDALSEYDDACNVYSFESFVNDYVFNSWKNETPKKVMDWLD